MSRFNRFVKRAFQQAKSVLPNKVIVIRGEFIDAVANVHTYEESNDYGGYTLNNGLIVVVNTEDLPSDLKSDEIVTVDGKQWVMDNLSHGDTVTNITLVDSSHD